MKKSKKDSPHMVQLLLLLKENQSFWGHATAIVILIQRFGDIEKARRSDTFCLENMAIDELQTELMESIRVLLNDK